MNNLEELKQLHERDFNLWVEEMAIAIKNRDIKTMDWENLLDEIEDMAKSDKRALRSYTQRLIEHIFKLKYWESERERNQNGWKSEVINFRGEIQNILEDSPSLRNYLADNYLDWYRKSFKKYQKDNLFQVPEHQPVRLEQILNDDYFGLVE